MAHRHVRQEEDRTCGTKSVLTISHTYGSGGSRIAHALGQRLGWTVWEKAIVRKIATQYKVSEEYVEAKDERVDSFIERMVGLFGMGGFESAYDIPPPLWLNDAQLVRMTRSLIEEVARGGRAILVGRGSNYVLAGQPAALHVFLAAPFRARIERVMEIENLSRDEAAQRIAGMDRLRADYVHTFYHGDWRDPSRYHLMIDASVWGEAGAADLILQALERAAQSV